jgi:hypothetical protein
MVFNVCVGVKDLTFSDCSAPSTKFSMLVADTVRFGVRIGTVLRVLQLLVFPSD